MWKDLYILKNLWKSYAVVVGFLFISGAMQRTTGMFQMMCSVMLYAVSLTSFSMDEKANFSVYALGLPLSRSDLVKEKYGWVCILSFLNFLLCIVGALFLHVFLQVDYDHQSFQTMVLYSYQITLCMMILQAIALPFLFQFGVQKARLFTAVLFFIGFLLVICSSEMGGISLFGSGGSNALCLTISMPCIYLISYAVSITCMKQKEF